jgi:hypothetical protein
MRRTVYAGLVLVGAVLAASVAFAGQSGGGTAQAARGHWLTPLQQRLVSGAAAAALEQAPVPAAKAQLRSMRSAAATVGTTAETGCPANRGSNIRVNQNCENLSDPDLAGRGQAQNETAIAQDPNNPGHIVASSNDYRRGDGNCYAYFSSDNGQTWQDSTPPMSFTRGTLWGKARQYWQAGGDTSVAWDTKGNAYLSCQMFNRGAGTSANPDQSSAFYVFRSTGTGGASWNFPARPVAEFNDTAGAGTTLLDKQYLTVDNHAGSRFQDRIYVTWTRFDPDGTGYIYEAHSSDYGESFSAPVLVSKDSSLCPEDLGLPTPNGACNENQDSQPFTGPDGALYVVYDNFNVTSGPARGGDDEDGGGDNLRGNAAPAAGVDNRNQVLLAKSTDGGNTFSDPIKVADYYDLPDCDTYQGEGKDPGRSCVPEKGPTGNSVFRATNYPSGAVNPRNRNEIDVTIGSYINRNSNESNGCVPEGFTDAATPLYDGVKTPGACNNDILISRSTNGGASFTGTTTDPRELTTVRNSRADQFWQWAAINRNGTLAVAYYNREYGNDEQTGFSDFSLSGSLNGSTFSTNRLTTSSMPPPSQFSGQFFGDYSGMSAVTTAHPLWMDTRDPELFTCRDSAGIVTKPPSVCTASAANADVANDENLYTRTISIPLP